MKNEMEVKSHVLEMLKELLMGTDGGKFKPKGMSVEVITASPKKGKGGLDDVLKEASEENPVDEEECYSDGGLAEKGGVEEMDMEHVDDDNYEPKDKRMTLKEFLQSRK